MTREAAKDIGLDIGGARVAIQGCGQVGSWTARIAAEVGCKVIAVSDLYGGVYREGGIDVEELLKHKAVAGSVAECPGTERLTNDELLELDCDVLIPAAVERAIHEGNASRVGAKVIVEAANHPVTPEADQILNDRGVPIIPDILANAGGVTVSYFEWTQNLYQHQWELERVNEERNKILTRAYHAVRETADREKITYREAAFLLGVGRVAHVARLRGFI